MKAVPAPPAPPVDVVTISLTAEEATCLYYVAQLDASIIDIMRGRTMPRTAGTAALLVSLRKALKDYTL